MIKKIKQSIALALASVMILGSFAPVLAVVDEAQTTSENETLATDVLYNQESNFTVTIPKLITLDNEKKSNYTVTVTGDIASNEKINVVPDKSFEMMDQATTGTKKDNVTATITQDKETWLFDEFATVGKGSVSAPNLTSGNWKGSFWFNISLDNSNEEENTNIFTLNADNLIMGSNESYQLQAFLGEEDATDLVEWSSDSENITVTEGLVETTASAQIGDSATITATLDLPQTYATVSEDNTYEASLTVTVIDMAFTASGETEVITSVDLKAGENKDIEVTIIPNSATGIVSWTTTAPAGVNLVKNGNIVTVKIASDMPAGNTYDLIASYGNFSKLLRINIVSDHIHQYNSEITKEPGCETTGIRTYTCSCNHSYTEDIAAIGHSYQNGTCLSCGGEDPDYEIVLPTEPGLYDGNGVLLCSYENSGIDESIDYPYETYDTTKTSGHYVITNKYPKTEIIVFPENITYIGQQSFRDCENLTYVVWPENLEGLGHHAFLNCNFKSIVIPDSLTSIGQSCFANCANATNVSIGSGLTELPLNIFSGCLSLTEIYIPETVTSIQNNIVMNCPNLTSIVISDKNPKYDSRNNCNAIIETSTNTLIAGCKNTIIPNDIEIIAINAFADCSSLTNITIPSSVTRINAGSFSDCTSLTNITIPSNVQKIVSPILDGCTSLESIVVEEGNTVYDSRNNCNAIIETSTNKLLSGCVNTIIPDDIQTIGEKAFKNYSNLEGILIPNSVTSIESEAFNLCTSLANITIPGSVKTLGSLAFGNCTNLTNVTIQNGLISMKSSFAGCKNLKTINIPDSVQTIGDSAFSDCSNLTEVVIGYGVETIGANAFKNTKLTSATFRDTSLWYYGNNLVSYPNKLDSANLSNKTTAANYLKSTYVSKYWVKK